MVVRYVWHSATPHGTRASTATMMLHDETNVWNFAQMLGDR